MVTQAKNGYVTWRALALIFALSGALITGCWFVAVRAWAETGDNAVAIMANTTRGETIQEDVRQIRREQMRQSEKIDRILERLSR